MKIRGLCYSGAMWFYRRKAVVDEGKIEEILSRGVAAAYPSSDFLRGELRSGKRLRLYWGIDPTGPTLHLGHAVILRKLRLFQELGHEVILLIGDFTGMIGDPTDKTATRRRLSRKEVLQNANLYKSQASKFLSFSGANGAVVKYNSRWLGKMKFEDVLNIAAHMTVDHLMKRDMFQTRTREGKPIYLHEFLYPLMQGYDSVAMQVDGELGGNDQTFNMLAGRTLSKQLKQKEKFVLATKLLTDSSGKKMGKTEGNMLTFQDSPEEMVGKVMSWSDELISSGFELCTGISLKELERIEEGIRQGGNPRDAKLRLAETIVAEFHGADAAGRAVETFIKTFSEGSVPERIPEVVVSAGTTLGEALSEHSASKSELRRLIDAGAVEEVGGKKFTRADERVHATAVVRIGKKKFVRITVR